MFHVGLDIHDKRIEICVLGQTGQIVRRAQVRTIDEMMRMLEALPDRFEVCYEADRVEVGRGPCSDRRVDRLAGNRYPPRGRDRRGRGPGW
jgi:hypothetical protein